MPALHVRDVPDTVLAALRERAARHQRSVQEEVRRILAAAAAEPSAPQPVTPLLLTTVSADGDATWSRQELDDDDGR